MVVVRTIDQFGWNSFLLVSNCGDGKAKQSFVQSQNFFLLSFLRVKSAHLHCPILFIISFRYNELTDEYLVIVFGLFGLVDHHLHL